METNLAFTIFQQCLNSINTVSNSRIRRPGLVINFVVAKYLDVGFAGISRYCSAACVRVSLIRGSGKFRPDSFSQFVGVICSNLIEYIKFFVFNNAQDSGHFADIKVDPDMNYFIC